MVDEIEALTVTVTVTVRFESEEMGSRVPVQHYNMRSPPNSFIGSPMHDLNTVDDSRSAKLESIGDVHRDAVDDSLDNDDDSSAVVNDCIHDSYSNSLPIHGVGVEEERSSLDNDGSSSSRAPYDILSLQGSNFNSLILSMLGMLY